MDSGEIKTNAKPIIPKTLLIKALYGLCPNCSYRSVFVRYITMLDICPNCGLKIDAATPGLSVTPTIVTLESFFVDEIPVMILLLKIFFELVIKVPLFFVKDDLIPKYEGWPDIQEALRMPAEEGLDIQEVFQRFELRLLCL